jgi:hypothetical protein
LQFTDDNELDNKNKKNDIINLRKVSQNKKESISTNNNEKRRSTIHVGSFLMEDIKKYEQLNKSNSSSQKSMSSSIDIHEKNTNIGNDIIIEENGNPQKLIEGIKQFNGCKMYLIYGNKDPSFNMLELFTKLESDKIKTIIFIGADHNFQGGLNCFIDLPDTLFFHDTEFDNFVNVRTGINIFPVY